MEPSLFSEENEDDSQVETNEDYTEEIVDEIVVESKGGAVEYYNEKPVVEEEDSEENYYSEMSVVEEEESEEEDDSEDDEDSSMDDVTALDDQSEQFEGLNDERSGCCENNGQVQEASTVIRIPSLVSNTSSGLSNTSPSVVSSVTETSSIALLRVRMCPMKIVYVLDGEENEYTGFYSGPM